MIKNERYFDNLCSMARLNLPENRKYRKLLWILYETPFKWIHPMDENRAIDGLDLRKEYFGRVFETEKVSVLEVLLAFSRRIETEIMSYDPEKDKPYRWFWVMLCNLGLLDDEICENEKKIDRILEIWMSRKFSKRGKGNIFLTHKTDTDLRTVEFWWQMQRYMSEFYGD